MIRIGHGQDAHRFAAQGSRPLVLGGVVVPGAAGCPVTADTIDTRIADGRKSTLPSGMMPFSVSPCRCCQRSIAASVFHE